MVLSLLSELYKPSQVDGQVDQLNEGSQHYDNSGDFTEDLFKAGSLIADLKKLSAMPRWVEWMKSTDANFGTNVVSMNADMVSALRELDKAYRVLEDALHHADDPEHEFGDDDEPSASDVPADQQDDDEPR